MSEAILVEGLTKAYNGKTVIDHLNLSVKSGTVFGLLVPTAREKASPSSAFLERSRQTRERCVCWDRTRRKTAVRCSSTSACSFRRATIRKKSGFPSFARKPQAFIEKAPIGAGCVNSSVSGIRQTLR